MRLATHRLAAGPDYDVPPQDLRISRRQVPALPASGFVVTDVTRRRAGVGTAGGEGRVAGRA